MPRSPKPAFDYKWGIAFALQFLVLLGSILWKGGAIESRVYSLEEKVKYEQSIIDQYFRK